MRALCESAAACPARGWGARCVLWRADGGVLFGALGAPPPSAVGCAAFVLWCLFLVHTDRTAERCRAGRTTAACFTGPDDDVRARVRRRDQGGSSADRLLLHAGAQPERAKGYSSGGALRGTEVNGCLLRAVARCCICGQWSGTKRFGACMREADLAGNVCLVAHAMCAARHTTTRVARILPRGTGARHLSTTVCCRRRTRRAAAARGLEAGRQRTQTWEARRRAADVGDRDLQLGRDEDRQFARRGVCFLAAAAAHIPPSAPPPPLCVAAAGVPASAEL